MATKVTTTSTCDKCGGIEDRDGAHSQTVPEKWASVAMRVQKGTGAVSIAELCPNCVEVVMKLLWPTPEPQS